MFAIIAATTATNKKERFVRGEKIAISFIVRVLSLSSVIPFSQFLKGLFASISAGFGRPENTTPVLSPL